MNQLFYDYNELLKIPKWSKKERHLKFKEWYAKEYDSLPSYKEFKSYINTFDKEDKIWETHFFLEKVLFPLHKIEIYNNKNIDALKFILANYHNKFLFFIENQKTNLLHFGLEINPKDKDLLNYKLDTQIRYFENTIHEIPWGVLYDFNGANVNQTKENLGELNNLQTLAKDLNRDIESLLQDCKYYYQQWINYLEDKSRSENFEIHLKKNPK